MQIFEQANLLHLSFVRLFLKHLTLHCVFTFAGMHHALSEQLPKIGCFSQTFEDTNQANPSVIMPLCYKKALKDKHRQHITHRYQFYKVRFLILFAWWFLYKLNYWCPQTTFITHSGIFCCSCRTLVAIETKRLQTSYKKICLLIL